jgi:glycosyltransferase involved in cell wall biosynthesis
VIASKVGGLPTIVHEGENGFLIPWRCPEAFAERINLLLNDRVAWSRLASHARPSVERFDWGAIAEQMLSIYREQRQHARPQVACMCGSMS